MKQSDNTDTSSERQPDGVALISAARDMLADACGGAKGCHREGHDASSWDLARYAEHIRDRQVAITELMFQLLPDHAETICDAYGDSFDAVERVLCHLELRETILDRLVTSGYVTESIIDDLEEMIVTERRESNREATP